MAHAIVIDIAAPDTRQQIRSLLTALASKLAFIDCTTDEGGTFCEGATLAGDPSVSVKVVMNLNGDLDDQVINRIEEVLGSQGFIYMNYFQIPRTRDWLRWHGIKHAYINLGCTSAVAFRPGDAVPATLTFTETPVPYPDFVGQVFR